MTEAQAVIIGVLVGGVLSTLIELLRRRWTRRDRIRDLQISRAEQSITDLIDGKEWANAASRGVFQGEIHVVPPIALLRATGIIPAYFPHLRPKCEQLGSALSDYLVWCSDTGARVKQGHPPPPTLQQDTARVTAQLHESINVLARSLVDELRSITQSLR